MKTTEKDLKILFVIIGIILISGCISEKQELKTLGEEQPEHKQPVVKQQQDETHTGENAMKEQGKDVNETESKREPAEQVNKIKSKETVNYSNMDWCEDKLAVTITECPSTRRIWTEGVVEFKGKPMCHAKYFVEGSNGERLYDWYFTEDKNEIYRVITYPNGSVEESKIEKSKEVEHEEYNLNDNNISEATKDPSEMVLGLNDLSEGYNIVWNKTGVISKEEHTYPPEKLSEMGWKGGYKTAFENEKTYLFSLNLDYKQYLKEGEIDEQLKKAFEDNNISFFGDVKAYKIDDKNWMIDDEYWLQKGRVRYYIIEETRSNLKVYKKSLSSISNYRFISDTNSVYSPDKIREVFNDAKQTMSDSLVFVSAPKVGSECILYKEELTRDGVNYTMYALIFRKLNVYEEIQIIGLTNIVEENEVIDLAKIVEGKIE